jgi:hypothetical protein
VFIQPDRNDVASFVDGVQFGQGLYHMNVILQILNYLAELLSKIPAFSFPVRPSHQLREFFSNFINGSIVSILINLLNSLLKLNIFLYLVHIVLHPVVLTLQILIFLHEQWIGKRFK